jgi:hypothetical protein
MINLSNAAAKRFGINWKDLGERTGDFWKINAVMVERVPMLFIVHEYTLFTLVRRKSQFRDLSAVANEIVNSCPWYSGLKTLTLGKNGNRRLTGSVNEMKRMTLGLFYPDQINGMEMAINQGLFSYLSAEREGYSTPFEAVELYAKGQTHWLQPAPSRGLLVNSRPVGRAFKT